MMTAGGSIDNNLMMAKLPIRLSQLTESDEATVINFGASSRTLFTRDSKLSGQTPNGKQTLIPALNLHTVKEATGPASRRQTVQTTKTVQANVHGTNVENTGPPSRR